MRISSALSMAVFAATVGVAVPALAFEIKDLTPSTPPAQALTYGLNQYNSGDKQTAAEALNFAAEKGMAGAQWKLGNMYAEGDGVPRDEYKAFELFSAVASHADDEDDSSPQSAPFVSNAFVRLGTYYQQGIPNTTVKPNFGMARQFYYNAASVFGNADAQLKLAHMYYTGEGGDRDLIQAAKWADLSADKGNPDAKKLAIQVSLDLAQAHLAGDGVVQSTREAERWARQAADYGSIDGQALLGHILFEGDGISRQVVDGLTLLTIALDRSGGDEPSIVEMHEEARSAATQEEWNAAKERADEWLAANPAVVASSDTASK